MAPPGDLGATLVGQTLLYWWPPDGWQRGTLARLCPRGAFSHVVAYTRQTSALRGTADTLLDAASYGTRWVLLSPAPAAGVSRALRPRPGPPGPEFGFGRWLVTPGRLKVENLLHLQFNPLQYCTQYRTILVGFVTIVTKCTILQY